VLLEILRLSKKPVQVLVRSEMEQMAVLLTHVHALRLAISAATHYLVTADTIPKLSTRASAMVQSLKRSKHVQAPRSAPWQLLGLSARRRSASAATIVPSVDQHILHPATCLAIPYTAALLATFRKPPRTAGQGLAQVTNALINAHARSQESW